MDNESGWIHDPSVIDVVIALRGLKTGDLIKFGPWTPTDSSTDRTHYGDIGRVDGLNYGEDWICGIDWINKKEGTLCTRENIVALKLGSDE